MKLSRRINNNKGTSLIEISLVLIIIGLTAAISLQNFSKINGSYNLDNSARLMALDIRSIQQTANKYESSEYILSFVLEEEKYYFRKNLTAYKTVNLPPNVDLEWTDFTGNKIAFAVSGNPAGGFGGTIALKDRETGKYKYVIIDSIGRVRVSNSSGDSS